MTETPKHHGKDPHRFSVPIYGKFNPEYYDGYKGKNELPTITTDVLVHYQAEGELQKALIRLAMMGVDPERPDPERKDYPETQRKKVTMIYLGGGDSDGLANMSIGAHIRDAQQALSTNETNPLESAKPKWDISGVLGVSLPVGAPRTQETPDKDTVKTSAKIIEKAIRHAIEDGTIKMEDHIVLMGFSNGGGIAIELAKLMKDKLEQLILVEPGSMTDQPNIKMNFILSGFRASGAQARKEGLGPKDTVKKMANDMRIHWTQPYGAPEDFSAISPVIEKIEKRRPKHIVERYRAEREAKTPIKSFADLKKILRKILTPDPLRIPPKYMTREEVYGLPAKPSALNVDAVGHDNTHDAREDLTLPIMLVTAKDAKVVNPRTALGNLPDDELGQTLFPNSTHRTVITVPTNSHGLGDKPELWREIIGKAEAIPLTENSSS